MRPMGMELVGGWWPGARGAARAGGGLESQGRPRCTLRVLSVRHSGPQFKLKVNSDRRDGFDGRKSGVVPQNEICSF